VAVAASTLVWFGTSFGSQPHVMVGSTKHCARLRCVNVGATSRARKGTSEDPVRLVFRAAKRLDSGEAGWCAERRRKHVYLETHLDRRCQRSAIYFHEAITQCSCKPSGSKGHSTMGDSDGDTLTRDGESVVVIAVASSVP
jgi:hypothetical protein